MFAWCINTRWRAKRDGWKHSLYFGDSLHILRDNIRDQTVNCVWGRGEATPDGIIWTSLQDHANMLLNDYHLGATGQLSAEERSSQIAKDYFVVRYRDLEALNADIVALYRTVGNFHAALRYETGHAGPAYNRLLAEPIIQKALARTAST